MWKSTSIAPRWLPAQWVHESKSIMSHRTRTAAWLLISMGVAMYTLPARAQILIQLSHVSAQGTPKDLAALRFKALAEERTAGRVKVEVYPNSQLYSDYEELQALQLGAVQMLVTSLSKLASLGVQEFEVFGLPFLFKDHAAFRAVADGQVGARLFEKLAAKGVMGLAYWDNGFEVMSANRPLQKVADFQGLRMRVQSSRVLVEQMKALGALPVVTPLTEQHAAFSAARLDGAENVPSNFQTQHLDQVQKHLTLSNHGYLAYAVLVNKSFWQGLPEDLRAVLQGALREATAYENQLAVAENKRALELIRKSGATAIHKLSGAEQREWQRALDAVHHMAEAWIGTETLRAVQAAAGYPSKR
jgi:C4-dicarboxylate-binding protein DctP